MATTAAQRLDSLEQNMAAILAALQAKQDDTTEPEPKATAKDKAKATASRSDSVKRNLDPVVLTDDDENGVEIVAAGTSGVFRQGARVKAVRKGKAAVGSFSRSEVEYIAANVDDIMAALDAVEKQAKIGSHLPKAAA